MAGQPEQSPEHSILDVLKNFEERLERIELHLSLPPLRPAAETEATTVGASIEEREEALELQIGQNWFAKVGIVVLALGIVFLLTFPYPDIPPLLPSLVGYLMVGGIVLLSGLLRRSYEQVSRYLFGGGLLLFYFSTIRLAYFSPQPAVTDTNVELVLLVIAVAVTIGVSLQRRSPYLMSISLTMGYLTALLGSQPYYVFGLITGLTLTVAYTHLRHAWIGVMTFGTVMAYLTHLLWALNTPILGNTLQIVPEPEGNLAFLLLYALILALGTLWRSKELSESAMLGLNSFLNSSGSFVLLLLLSLGAYGEHIAAWHGAGSVLFLGLATAFWVRERSLYSTFIYAMTGYTALSVAIIDSFPLADSLVWLCWQSILVLATAVWFRSRFIVIANFVIYVIVFLAYLVAAETVTTLSLSFGLVSLLSARILNWQRDRLELKTEMMRNAYLASALFFIPYALYHSLPAGFVTLSWLAVALLYYIVSRRLKNRKYRWMALATTVMAVLHLFIIDLVGLDPVFRIISFVVLGTALLVISMMYSRRKSSSRSSGESNEAPESRSGD
jgi:uncharacterized membrane protein